MNQRFDANCSKICANLLKDDEKQNQLALCKGLQEQATKETDLYPKFRTGDENWVYGYDAGSQQESSSCHPRELRQMKSDFKSMLSVFLNSEAIFQKEFLFLQCQPVNQQFCVGVQWIFMEAFGRKCLTISVHRTDFCIMTTCHATQIHGFSSA